MIRASDLFLVSILAPLGLRASCESFDAISRSISGRTSALQSSTFFTLISIYPTSFHIGQNQPTKNPAKNNIGLEQTDGRSAHGAVCGPSIHFSSHPMGRGAGFPQQKVFRHLGIDEFVLATDA